VKRAYQDQIDSLKINFQEDLKVAMERCDVGPCQLLIDKASPPIKENVLAINEIKSKLTLPDLNSYAGSPTTAALNCTQVQLRLPEAYSGF